MTLANLYVFDSSSIYNLGYHVVWCPKYTRKVLVGDIETRLKELLLEKAEELGITIAQIDVFPTYVHLYIKSKPTYAIHFVINQLKAYSSVALRKEFPELKTKLPTLWTRSYFVDNISKLSDKNVQEYVDNQKKV